MLEPSTEITEPVEDVNDETTEPVDEEIDEPASEDVDDSTEEKGDEQQFMDPKNLPPELQEHFKRMQGAFTKAMQGVKSKTIEEPSNDEPFNDEPFNPDEELEAFIQSDEGKLLDRAFDYFAKTKLGDLYQIKDKVEQKELESNVDSQIDDAIKTYGAESIKEHQQEIMAVVEQNKKDGIYVPLQYICAKILYPKAKESGKSEVRKQIQKKGDDSNINKGSSSSPINTSDRPVTSLRDAFNQALEEKS